jgi:CCR4-NOT transcription complex subunit 7/8
MNNKTRYPPQNISNPFAQLHQPGLHSTSHIPHQNANLQHPGFGGGNPNGGISIFGPQSGNAGLRGAFGEPGGLGLGGGTGLGSQAAQMGFAHGAAIQQQQAHDAAIMGAHKREGQATRIREVWKDNLEEEMATLRQLVDRYPYVSMACFTCRCLPPAPLTNSTQDTEFPGVVARPMGEFTSKASYHYQTLRCNVDLLKIIQLGITLFSVDGEPAPPTELAASFSRGNVGGNVKFCPCTWTFNFKFSPEEDMYNDESLNLLKKAGSDFNKHQTMGIDPDAFGSLLISSGMVMSDDVFWISFHSGYDFAYLVKLMKPECLPDDEVLYRELVKIFFPNIYDVKYMLRYAQRDQHRPLLSTQAQNFLTSLGTKSGLQDLAEELQCQRVGVQHQAGSDAWLTGSVFWQMKTKIFNGDLPSELNGQMWGLTGYGTGPPANAATQAAVLAAQGHAANGLASQNPTWRTDLTPSTHRAGEPATPTTNAAALAQTPGPSQGYQSVMTPGGSGVFGNFQYGK